MDEQALLDLMNRQRKLLGDAEQRKGQKAVNKPGGAELELTFGRQVSTLKAVVGLGTLPAR